MFALTLKAIRARKARFLLTATAVVLGVAFVAGTLVLTDTIGKAFDGVAATKYDATDAVVRSNRVVEDEFLGTTRGSISDDVLDKVRGIDGVAVAEPLVEGIARLVGRDGRLVEDGSEKAIPIAFAWHAAPGLNPLQLVAGRGPRAADEVVIDRASARDGDFGVGDTVRILTRAGSAEYTVAGIATYGEADDAGGAAVVAFTPDAAVRALGESGRIGGVQVLAAPGVSQSDLATRIAQSLSDPNLEVLTGDAVVADEQAETRSQMAFMSTFLMIFAVVALIVGGFVIFNAFSITVAQRTRETAMMRAIGATRKQLSRMVVLESFAVGLVASAIGVGVGVGLAAGLRRGLEAYGLELPAGSTVLSTKAVVISMVLGILVTVLAAYLPSRRASKVAPVTAMRNVAVDTSGRSARRAVVGTALAGLGALLLVAGLSGSGPAFGLGTLTVFAAAVVLGPVVATRFTAVVGAPIATLRGMTGVLARDNASRNPKRTAATASALMIGVALVVLITVFAASARTSVAASIDNSVHSDWIIDSVQVQDGLSPAVADAVAALPEVGSVTSLRSASATMNGRSVRVAGVDPVVIGEHYDADVTSGSFAGLGNDGVGVARRLVEVNGWHTGDSVALTFAETGVQRFKIVATYETTDPLGEYVISQRAYEANVAAPHDDFVLVMNAPGMSSSTVRSAIDGVLAGYPTGSLHTLDEFKASIAGEIDKMLNLIYALLFFAVVIALFGIANTLALSVVERKRELGLLRAVGMQRSQVRSGVRWEAVLIALLGTFLGTTLGVTFGWVLVKALANEGIDRLAIPGMRLGVIAIVAALAAVAAAAVPARRASRLDVLASIAD